MQWLRLLRESEMAQSMNLMIEKRKPLINSPTNKINVMNRHPTEAKANNENE